MLTHTIQNPAQASLGALRDAMPDYARDIRLNLGTVLTSEGAPELSSAQIAGIALATAYATKNPMMMQAMAAEAAAILPEAAINAARIVAAIMAMNNVYYRFVHLVGDADFQSMPARLRMNALAAPGVPKVDFELMSLAVSALNGCGMCIEAHTRELLKHGSSKLAIQSAIRIAATIAATAQVIAVGEGRD